MARVDECRVCGLIAVVTDNAAENYTCPMCQTWARNIVRKYKRRSKS